MDLNDTNYFMMLALGDLLTRSCYPAEEEESEET